MIKKLTGAALAALADLIKLALGVVVLIALIAWARANPDAAEAVAGKVMAALAAVITWASDLIISWTD